jgi:hypothetical protein
MMEIEQGICYFCAREYLARWDEEHKDEEDTSGRNKSYWKAYYAGKEALTTACVQTGDYFDDFASGWDGEVRFYICRRHALEAAEALA